MTLPMPLIGAAELVQRLTGRQRLRVFDCSFDLADTAAGEHAWAQAHVPGAHYLNLDRDLADHGPAGRGRGRHPLPAAPAFAATLGRHGVDPTLPVVVYDRSGAVYAARAWWMLRWIGHPEVAVLDGGWQAWLAAGGASDADAPVPPLPARYAVGSSLAATVDARVLLVGLGRVRLIDARTPERFRGDVEPLDPVAGHIPGALNHSYKDNLGPDGRFLPPEALRAAFEPLLGGSGPQDAVHQCGSGVTACHNLLAMEAAGLHGSILYPGSWSEWCSDPARPVARA